MITVYSEKHKLHCGLLDPRTDGQFRPSSESPERANNVVQAILKSELGPVRSPRPFNQSDYLSVHAQDYLSFLQNVWPDWLAAGQLDANARPDTFVGAGMRYADTHSVIGKLGRYSFDSTSPFVAGSWQAIQASADCALTGAALLDGGARYAFAACRPPGHHAAKNFCGGYCYLNNNSLAAQSLLSSGAGRVAILDVDYHHGNGTQSIFYQRDDVLTISIHADPSLEYPYFIGFADECGEDQGQDFNVNYPLPFGTHWDQYSIVLSQALKQVQRFSPDALVVSLGLDTFAGDPTTHFSIESADFIRMGQAIGELGLPTLTVLEGGYSVKYIGLNAVNFLSGLEG